MILLFATEAECAVASSADLHCGRQVTTSTPLSQPSLILSADLGCGTNDYALAERIGATDMMLKLNVLEEKMDLLVGSQRTDKYLLAIYKGSRCGDEAAVEKARASVESFQSASRLMEHYSIP